MQDWEMVAYERLRTEIVRSVVYDLRRAMKKSDREGFVCAEQKKLEAWFLSKWGQFLSGDNGEYIIEQCRKTYKTHTIEWADPITPEREAKAHKDYKAGMSRKEIMKKHNISDFQYWQMLRRHGR